MAHALNLALLQHACPVDAPPEATLAVCCGMIEEAAGRGADLVVTQELFASPYFPQTEDEAHFDLAQAVSTHHDQAGEICRRLSSLAKKLSITISGSVFERRAPGLYHNTTVTYGPNGDLIGRYRKMHIPDDPRFYEKYYFTPGDLGWQTFDFPPCADQASGETASPRDGATAPTKVGTLICWDQWFPEAARLTALKGASLLLYPTAIGYYNDAQHGEPPEVREQQREAWQTMMQSHAIANGVFVAAANRIGTEDDLTFWGGSFVCGPDGQIIAQASGDEQEILMAECDLSLIETQRRGWPLLRDRRIDAYDGLWHRMDDEA